MAPLGPGRIVWAVYPGDRGDGKTRPMIVTNRRTDINKTGQIVVVVCSTDFTEPLQPDEVLIPSHPDGKCITGLRAKGVAVCNWTATLPVTAIVETSGFVPKDLLREICRLAGFTYTPER